MISTISALLGGGTLTSLSTNIKLDELLSLAIRMALIGLFAAAVRHVFGSTKSRLYDAIFPTAHILATDPAFEWIMSYLAQSNQAQRQLKSFRLITADARQSKRDDANRLRTSTKKVEGLTIARKDATFVEDVVGQISPVNEQAIFINHKGTYLWITRRSKGYANSDPNERDEHIEITGLSVQPEGIKQFILDAHAMFFKKADNELLIFNVSPYTGNWIDPIHRPSRSWSSVILPESDKAPLLRDVKNFLSDEEKAWYGARGIPHRRGYLLHGRPGSGKTTLATAIASQLGLDIYIVNPAARGMDDGKLNKAFRNCPPQNMILIEDIDCVMPPRPKRVDNDDEDDDDSFGTNDTADPGKYGLARSTVTLSGLLNAIDGVSSQEDCILFATTNHPDRLDSALSRPGRFDLQLSFKDATFDQAKALFKHFFPLSDFANHPNATARVVDEKESPEVIQSEEDLDALAHQFAEGVFFPSPSEESQNGEGKVKVEIEFGLSMAALQGFLLTHKKTPRLAAEKSSEWSNNLRQEQEERERKKLARRAEREKLKEANGNLTPVIEKDSVGK
ncbi:hypothetical protein I302_100669 [Kwoniella bestiolae CBS 10118]|uniref:Mitochondrial chaperone BCS1 n=1 Tax=Kwoniella bestiolae CBS 10118 TaxID=1296100 RepID=A0A1B9G5T5_9TREE|nr:hypothetical protein I302_04044 [Kwoniella bestiolae CBS 10118]OCF26361.1 hypothetical protein I302_04044 [Kwoniella bestiolae CBS 10118]